jgi:hypothetical protein
MLATKNELALPMQRNMIQEERPSELKRHPGLANALMSAVLGRRSQHMQMAGVGLAIRTGHFKRKTSVRHGSHVELQLLARPHQRR